MFQEMFRSRQTWPEGGEWREYRQLESSPFLAMLRSCTGPAVLHYDLVSVAVAWLSDVHEEPAGRLPANAGSAASDCCWLM